MPMHGFELVEWLAEKQKLLAGVPVFRLMPQVRGAQNLLLVAVSELTTEAEMDLLAAALKKGLA